MDPTTTHTGINRDMNPELLELAQEEYERQYDEWLKSKPVIDDTIETIKKMFKKFKNYT